MAGPRVRGLGPVSGRSQEPSYIKNWKGARELERQPLRTLAAASKGPGFFDPHCGLQPPVTPVPRDSTPLPGLLVDCSHMVCLHTCRQTVIHVKLKTTKPNHAGPGEEAEAVGRPKVSLMPAWATENKPCLKQKKTNLTRTESQECLCRHSHHTH